MKKINKFNENLLRTDYSKVDIRDAAVIVASTAAIGATFCGILFYPSDEKPVYTSTAIIMEDGNATIVDLESYEASEQSLSRIESWVLHTSNGDNINVDSSSVRILTSENSHEWAEELAEEMVSEGGRITYYGKNTSKTLKLGL